MIITFHSLEEKLVSQAFAIWKKQKLGDFACKKPHEPTQEELTENSRSQSAKLFSFLFD
jgi:16S rRNA C1402 N4-methylase RsmH